MCKYQDLWYRAKERVIELVRIGKRGHRDDMAAKFTEMLILLEEIEGEVFRNGKKQPDEAANRQGG